MREALAAFVCRPAETDARLGERRRFQGLVDIQVDRKVGQIIELQPGLLQGTEEVGIVALIEEEYGQPVPQAQERGGRKDLPVEHELRIQQPLLELFVRTVWQQAHAPVRREVGR